MSVQRGLARGPSAAAAIAALSTVLACSGGDVNITGGSPTTHWIPTGTGPVIEETRAVSGVSTVVLEGAGWVSIQQGATDSLLVRTHQQVMPYIKTELRSGQLVLGFTAGARFQGEASTIEFRLTVADLRRVELRGAGRIAATDPDPSTLTIVHSGVGGVDVTGLTATRLDVTRSGVGDVDVSGTVDEQSVVLGGTGSYEASGLASAEAAIRIQASGSAIVRVSDRLDARIEGAGWVRYYGDPVVERTGSGPGSVERLGP